MDWGQRSSGLNNSNIFTWTTNDYERNMSTAAG
jgi:hypothetical protein